MNFIYRKKKWACHRYFLLLLPTNILRIMILIEFVISKFLHILNKISNADDLGLIFYGSIGLCSRMACSMVAWYYVVCVCALEPHFFGTCRLSAPCGSSRRFDFRSVDPAGSFVRSRDPLETMILESHERCCCCQVLDARLLRLLSNGGTTRGNCTEATSFSRVDLDSSHLWLRL